MEDIQKAHDEAFKARGIHPSAWTPYKLLEAARAYGGREEAEAVWAMLLDNKRLGLDRMEATSNLVLGKYRELIDDPVGYLSTWKKRACHKGHSLFPTWTLTGLPIVGRPMSMTGTQGSGAGKSRQR